MNRGIGFLTELPLQYSGVIDILNTTQNANATPQNHPSHLPYTGSRANLVWVVGFASAVVQRCA